MAENKTPNILYIFADQHRKFDIGCYGHEFVKTPNLDKLASEGLIFEHCISNSPVCVPARGAMLTGLHAGKHKAFTNDISVDTSCTSIANVLKNAGYFTGYIGKWHLGGIPRDQFITENNRLGFEEWKVANCNHDYLKCYYDDRDNNRYYVDGYEPEIFGELALDFLEEQKDAKTPWALYVSFATPHGPLDIIDEKYLEEYKDIEIQLRPNTDGDVMLNKTTFLNLEQYRKDAKGYFSHITAIDRQIGLLMEKLKANNQWENTIIIYSADHGDMLGSHGARDKQVPYEESIGIPLIAFWKNHIYHGICDELIGLVDIPVSLAGLIGTKFSSEVDGEDLSDLFTNPKSVGYSSAYMYDYYPAHQGVNKGIKAWRGIRTKKYTYAVQFDNLDWLLFDNENDPYQLNNLAGKPEHKKLQEELWKELQKHINKHDKLISGFDYVVYSGQVEEFNKSQIHFNYGDHTIDLNTYQVSDD